MFKGHGIMEKTFDRFLREEFPNIFRRQFQSNSPYHDITLVDIRYSFLKRPSVVEYITENLLQSGTDILEDVDHLLRHYPDGVVRIEISKEIYTFCLEYDAHGKSRYRYEEFLNKYYLDRNVTAVFFIYRKKTAFQTLISLEREIYPKMTPKIFYCSLDKILSSNKKISFINKRKRKLDME